MSTAIVDTRGWQNVFDLKTGKKITDNSAKAEMIKDVLRKHPYPGDLDNNSNRWVTDTALNLIKSYDPGFAFLIYAGQYYSFRYNLPDENEIPRQTDSVFAEVDRFSEESGFDTIVIGTGDMIPVKGYIDLSSLRGMAVVSNWSTRYAGLYDIEKSEINRLNCLTGIEKIITKEEFISIFSDSRVDIKHMPDYLATASPGYCFRSTLLRVPFMIPDANYFIPVSRNAGEVTDITDINTCIIRSLNRGKTALVLIEGIGCRNFRVPYNTCRNGRDCYYYESGGTQYMTMSTGKHEVFAYPAGYRSYLDDDENKEYPFSGYFTSMPEGTVGSMYKGKSISAGNRSTFMHTITGTDIAVECFARNLANQGCLGVIHR